MRWDRLFEDLEDQLSSEWEAERAALDSESERLRLSRLPLRERLHVLAGCGPEGGSASLELVDGTVLRARITAVGADWAGAEAVDARATSVLVPFGGIAAVGLSAADVLLSARPDVVAPPRSLAERMTLGFVLRDLARRRVPLSVHVVGGRAMSGTIDRALHDHLDLALHDPGAPRRSDAVTGLRLIPYSAVVWVGVNAAGR